MTGAGEVRGGRFVDSARIGAWRDRLAVLALVGVVVLAFWRGLANGLVGDDFALIDDCRPDGPGSVLRAFDLWHDTWYYRPITRLVFAFGYTFFGTAPGPYHVLSLLAHSGAVVLLYFAARRAGASAAPAFAGALVFAVHFCQHESVFWFSAISYPLSTALGLGSALLFCASLERRRTGFLVASLALAAAAMLTKDTATVLPVLVALYGLLFGSRAGPRGQARRGTSGFLLLGLVMAIGVGLQAVPAGGQPFARGGTRFSPKGVRASAAFVADVAVLVVPGLDSVAGPARRAGALGLAACFVAYVLIRRTPLALLGLGWAGLALLPFWAFVPRIRDLYLYLPLVGVALVVADVAELVVAAPSRRILTPAAALGLAMCVLWSSGRLRERALRWREAGEIVDGVVAAVRAARPGLGRGATLVLTGLPDHVGGVHAFNNAVPSAFRLAFGDPTLNVLRAPRVETWGVPAATFLFERGRFYEIEANGRRRWLRTFADPDGHPVQ